MKVKLNYGKCVIAVQGVDMNCPLCGVLVVSGTRHECEQKKPRTKRLPGPAQAEKGAK